MKNKNTSNEVVEVTETNKNIKGFNTEELTKLIICGCGAFGCFTQANVITIPSFVSNTLTTISNLTLPQITIGMIVGLGTAIFTSEVIQNMTDNKEEK